MFHFNTCKVGLGKQYRVKKSLKIQPDILDT